ncbi:unnamed protein product [Prorocentrum cordatum]|uniref:Uncharacterized protein n=1 Tax=Prorocentrum cordatum TaxID=2364126 RepID=A0ABN9VCQ0_9DINO|nr:unnamed protein product [Polarella glacialis]
MICKTHCDHIFGGEVWLRVRSQMGGSPAESVDACTTPPSTGDSRKASELVCQEQAMLTDFARAASRPAAHQAPRALGAPPGEPGARLARALLDKPLALGAERALAAKEAEAPASQRHAGAEAVAGQAAGAARRLRPRAAAPDTRRHEARASRLDDITDQVSLLNVWPAAEPAAASGAPRSAAAPEAEAPAAPADGRPAAAAPPGAAELVAPAGPAAAAGGARRPEAAAEAAAAAAEGAPAEPAVAEGGPAAGGAEHTTGPAMAPLAPLAPAAVDEEGPPGEPADAPATPRAAAAAAAPASPERADRAPTSPDKVALHPVQERTSATPRSDPFEGEPSTSWKRKMRRLRLAAHRQAAIDFSHLDVDETVLHDIVSLGAAGGSSSSAGASEELRDKLNKWRERAHGPILRLADEAVPEDAAGPPPKAPPLAAHRAAELQAPPPGAAEPPAQAPLAEAPPLGGGERRRGPPMS